MRFILIIFFFVFSLAANANIGDMKDLKQISVIANLAVATNKQTIDLSSHPQTILRAAGAPTNTDIWFHDVSLVLLRDDDFDGFSSSISVRFDADTVFNHVPLYAIVYLGKDERYESIYTTDNFSINGNSSTDDVSLDIELVSGYPTNDYDMLIELFDAVTHEPVSYADHYSFSALAYIPLESQNYEDLPNGHVIVDSHGGSFSGFFLVYLLLSGLYRYRNLFWGFSQYRL